MRRDLIMNDGLHFRQATPPLWMSETAFDAPAGNRVGLPQLMLQMTGGDGELPAGRRPAPPRDQRLPRHRYHHVVKDMLIRLTGLIGIGLSVAAIYVLYRHIHGSKNDGDVIDYVLATIGFLSASIGNGLLLLGKHTFDKVEVSERWRRRM